MEHSQQLVDNPTVYLPNKKLRSVFKHLIFLEIFAKTVVFLSCFPPWGSEQVVKEQRDFVLLGFTVLLSCLNVYYLGYLGYRKDEIPMKRRYCQAVLHPISLFATVNIVSKIFFAEYSWSLPAVRQLFDTLTGAVGICDFYSIRPILLLLLVSTDIAFVTIGMCYCLQIYEPLRDSQKYRKISDKRKSTVGLTILDSRSFQILLKNDSDSELTQLDLEISREVTSKKDSSCGFFQTNSVSFPLHLPPLKVGEMVTIVPETHRIEGGVKAPRLRAFGHDVGERVVTRLRDKQSGQVSQLMEEYGRRRGGRPGEPEGSHSPVCPKWSRTAQNPNYMRTLM